MTDQNVAHRLRHLRVVPIASRAREPVPAARPLQRQPRPKNLAAVAGRVTAVHIAEATPASRAGWFARLLKRYMQERRLT